MRRQQHQPIQPQSIRVARKIVACDYERHLSSLIMFFFVIPDSQFVIPDLIGNP
jgi:hypothetical protein